MNLPPRINAQQNIRVNEGVQYPGGVHGARPNQNQFNRGPGVGFGPLNPNQRPNLNPPIRDE